MIGFARFQPRKHSAVIRANHTASDGAFAAAALFDARVSEQFTTILINTVAIQQQSFCVAQIEAVLF